MSSETSSVDEARKALGKRLRELRQQAGLSGKELAESLSWVGSKVSKIENGKQTPTDQDIRAWAAMTHVEDQTESLLAALHNLELLDRLMAISSMRNVKLGIIGFKTQYVIDPCHGFWLLDDDLVRVETYSAELNLRQPQEIELYSRTFEQHAAVASYGATARAIIGRVMQELAAEADEPGS
jgi:transcriptional regulator with XRE-family HTH domain